MALPVISDFITYIGRLITGSDWNNNWNKVIDMLADGTYDLNVNQITASTYVGVPGTQLSVLVAGEAIPIGKACYLKLSDGLLYLTDNALASTIDTYVGISTDDYSVGESVVLERILYAGFSGLTKGLYYLGGAGGITSTVPTSGIIRPIGLAINATSLLLDFNVTNTMYYGKGYVDYLSGNDLIRTQST